MGEVSETVAGDLFLEAKIMRISFDPHRQQQADRIHGFAAQVAETERNLRDTEAQLSALRSRCEGLEGALREMLELRAANQAGRLTDKHELAIVANARELLSAGDGTRRDGMGGRDG